MRLRSIVVPFLALVILSSVLYARWSRRPAPPVGVPEEAVVLPSPSEPAPTVTPPGSEPTASDVEPALDHLFDRSLVLDREMRPRFVTGDFTGDSVTDLAAAVRPRDADALHRLNAELPRWRIQDATAPADGGRGKVAPILAGERLLAIVHGVAGSAWSDAAAIRPAWLVRHAAGASLRARPLAALPAEVRMRVTRAHVGDAVAVRRERGGPGGIVFWNGGGYVWADLPDGSASAVTDDGRSGPP